MYKYLHLVYVFLEYGTSRNTTLENIMDPDRVNTTVLPFQETNPYPTAVFNGMFRFWEYNMVFDY